MNHPADIERFWNKVSLSNECWVWTAGKVQDRYGAFQLGTQRQQKVRRAHILMYEILVGPVQKGLVLDHLCRNQACVNPGHLEPVTQGENVKRGDAGANNRIKTHCPQGHEYTPENTILRRNARNSGVARWCRTCVNNRGKLYQRKRRQNATT